MKKPEESEAHDGRSGHVSLESVDGNRTASVRSARETIMACGIDSDHAARYVRSSGP